MSQNRKNADPMLTSGRVFACMLLMLVLIAEVFFDTWCGVQCRRMGYEIVEARSRQEELIETRKKLRIEQGRLKSPQVLGTRAKKQQGLITPKPEQVIIIQ